MSNSDADKNVLLAQLQHLNDRVLVYVTRLWHMPFAYLAIVSIAISQFQNIEIKLFVILIAGVLFLSGCTINIMIFNHIKRVDQLIAGVHEIEALLGLDESMVRQKVAPYYFLVTTSCIAVVYAAIVK